MTKKILLLILTVTLSILVSIRIKNQNYFSKINGSHPITIVDGPEKAKIQAYEILPKIEIKKTNISVENIKAAKAIRYEQNEDIIQNEKIDSVVKKIESMSEDWQIFRTQIYLNLEIDPFQEEQLQMARGNYQSNFDELAGDLSHANSVEIKEKIIISLQNLNKYFDTEVEVIVGKPKFKQMKQQRDRFNLWLLSKKEIETRIVSDW